MFSSFSWSADDVLTTEDLLSNANFEQADNLGLPIDWNVGNPDEKKYMVAVDTETKYEGESSLMITVTDDGNTGDIHIAQNLAKKTDRDPSEIVGREKLYCRAWVKYKDVSSIAAYQLVIQQAQTLSSAPWISWKGWDSFFADAGTQDEWKQVEGEIDIHPDANAWIFRVYLRKNMFPGCTVWVDNIEIQTADFGSVPVVKKIQKKERSNALSLNGNNVVFNRPTNYRLNVFTPNGKQYFTTSGYGSKIDLADANVAAGYYIINILSDIGNMTQPFIMPVR